LKSHKVLYTESIVFYAVGPLVGPYNTYRTTGYTRGRISPGTRETTANMEKYSYKGLEGAGTEMGRHGSSRS